jgi:hypothetical protein
MLPDENEVTLSEYSAVRIDVFINLASSCFDKQANDQLRRMSETTLHIRSNTYLY